MLPDPGGLQAYLNGTTRYVWHETFDIAGVATFSTIGTPSVKRGRMRSVLGREVASVEFSILCGSGSGLLTSALSGAWDGAVLVVSRVFNGSITLERFRGYVAEVRPTAATIEVVGKSVLADLNMQLPARSFSTACPWIFGSAECGATGALCEHTPTTCSGAYGGFPAIPSSMT